MSRGMVSSLVSSYVTVLFDESYLGRPAFLRTLEYFNGIIIMTTNRMDTMDVAFQSRIQLAIEYKHLNIGSRRKIWGMFINKLENADAREELLDEMEYLKKSNVNGRQIRSVMKVSESLAKNDGREHISVAHVKRALETASLQEYFEGRKELSRGNLRVSLQGSRPESRRAEEEDED
jgi:AAA+ superfamily predicted ATPase